jgi:hypothetical protein
MAAPSRPKSSISTVELSARLRVSSIGRIKAPLTERPFSAPPPPPPRRRCCPPTHRGQPACHGIFCLNRAVGPEGMPTPQDASEQTSATAASGCRSGAEHHRGTGGLPGRARRESRGRGASESTARTYGKRLRRWCYPHVLADGRLLGDVPVDQVTCEMLGAMIRQIREASRSLAITEGARNPLRSYYADLIETKALVGANPAADLKHFVGRPDSGHLRARRAGAARSGGGWIGSLPEPVVSGRNVRDRSDGHRPDGHRPDD